MSKIEQLIKQYCPNGVKMVRIGDYFQRLKGTPITASIMKEIAHADGEIKIFAGGKTIVNAYERDIPNANIIKTPAVLVQSRGVIGFVYYDKPFTFKNEMWAYTCDNAITLKYLYYYCNNKIDFFRDAASGMGSMPQISLPVTENYYIPLPPLPIQEKIAKILDKFSLLSAELEAELELQKKRYDFYRNRILSFDSDSDTVQWKTLGEVCRHCYAGATPSTSIKAYWESGTIPWMSSGEVNKGQIFNVDKRITKLGFDNCSTKMVPKNSVVIALAGQGKTRGTVAITRIDLCTNQSLCALIPNTDILSADYMWMYLKTQYVKLRDVSAGDGTRGGLNLQMIKAYPIPVPSIERQNEIVKLLVRFDKLVNDLAEGIPAEIERVRKQYEYYRNLLLTFPIAEE